MRRWDTIFPIHSFFQELFKKISKRGNLPAFLVEICQQICVVKQAFLPSGGTPITALHSFLKEVGSRFHKPD